MSSFSGCRPSFAAGLNDEFTNRAEISDWHLRENEGMGSLAL